VYSFRKSVYLLSVLFLSQNVCVGSNNIYDNFVKTLKLLVFTSSSKINEDLSEFINRNYFSFFSFEGKSFYDNHLFTDDSTPQSSYCVVVKCAIRPPFFEHEPLRIYDDTHFE